MRKFLKLVAVLLIVPFTMAVAETAPSPKAEMNKTVTEIIRIVEQNSGDAVKEKRRELLRELINPRFDFNEMSKRSLGTYWNDISAEEQADFVKVFSNLLARTYLSKIETVKTGMIQVTEEEVTMPKAVVKTTVESKGETFPIDYKMRFDSGTWQVYDVVIENIGLVANYRNEFAGIIRKDAFAGLMQKLREKTA